eukprot:TRINITY_DN3252_c0_g1_i1.p1 TRINITY_DN3252_c0_g1~~TRINITY_DN3252_c0_g1_i1.p1  ORF type:complete len:1053 (+),score=195.79 TRINITY_DN3252_c0_g1_i1:51-3161(+)
MDTAKLHEALLNSYNPDATARKQAEVVLDASKQWPGAVRSYYDIAITDGVDSGIRLAAAIRLKALISSDDWNEPNSKVSQDDRTYMKATLVGQLCNCPKLVRKQLLEFLRYVMSYDFPDKWPSLADEILSHLKGNDVSKMDGALFALRKLVKRYQTIEGERRKNEVDTMTNMFFEILVQIFEHVNKLSPTQNDDVATIQKLLLKIFYSTNYKKCCPLLMSNTNLLQRWMECILFTLKQPCENNANNDSVCWLTKKWVGHCIYALLTYYTAQHPDGPNKEFGKSWVEHFGTHFCEVMMEMIVTTGRRMSAKATCRLIACIQSGVMSRKIYDKLSSNIDKVLTEGLFPLLAFNEDDMELWESNPQDYIRKYWGLDDLETEYNDPKSHALSLSHVLCLPTKKFFDQNLLTRYLNFILTVLTKTQDRNNLDAMRSRYAAFTAIGGLRKVLKKKPQILDSIEGLFAQHLMPDYESRFGFVRANAIHTAAYYAKMLTWKEPKHFQEILNKNIQLMRDPDLPVRIKAGMSLRKVLAVPIAGDFIKPILRELIQACFSLMNEIDSEDLVRTLEVIIDKFGADLHTEAMDLCSALVQHFLKSTKNGTVVDEETTAAGSTCVHAISALIGAVRQHPETVMALQVACIPLVTNLLKVECSEFLEDSLRLITIIILYSRTITPEFWQVYHSIFAAFEFSSEWAAKHFLAPIDNFISKDPAAFVSDENRIIVFMKFCKSILETKDITNSQQMIAPKLIEVVLHYCKDHHANLDRYIPGFYDMILARMNSQEEKGKVLQIGLCSTILNGLWYNASATLQYLESHGVTSAFFAVLFDLLRPEQAPSDAVEGEKPACAYEKFGRLQDLKIITLAVTEVLSLGLSGPLPAFFTPEIRQQLAITALMMDINRYEYLKDAVEESEEEDSDSEINFMDLQGGGDELGGFMLGDEDLQKLCNDARLAEGDAGFLLDDDDDDDDISWSVIDEINQAQRLKSYLEALQSCNANAFQAFVAAANQINPQIINTLNASIAWNDEQCKKAVEQNREVNFGGQ